MNERRQEDEQGERDRIDRRSEVRRRGTWSEGGERNGRGSKIDWEVGAIDVKGFKRTVMERWRKASRRWGRGTGKRNENSSMCKRRRRGRQREWSEDKTGRQRSRRG